MVIVGDCSQQFMKSIVRKPPSAEHPGAVRPERNSLDCQAGPGEVERRWRVMTVRCDFFGACFCWSQWLCVFCFLLSCCYSSKKPPSKRCEIAGPKRSLGAPKTGLSGQSCRLQRELRFFTPLASPCLFGQMASWHNNCLAFNQEFRNRSWIILFHKFRVLNCTISFGSTGSLQPAMVFVTRVLKETARHLHVLGDFNAGRLQGLLGGTSRQFGLLLGWKKRQEWLWIVNAWVWVDMIWFLYIYDVNVSDMYRNSMELIIITACLILNDCTTQLEHDSLIFII